MDLFEFNNDICGYNTRNKNNLYTANVNLTKVKRGHYSASIRVFNHLRHNIKVLLHNTQKLKKKKTKEFFFQNPFYSVEDYFEYKEEPAGPF
jgi:acyl-[acyl carrier protein]--UDP-N-acetylglucosamine O-acyltransferase